MKSRLWTAILVGYITAVGALMSPAHAAVPTKGFCGECFDTLGECLGMQCSEGSTRICTSIPDFCCAGSAWEGYCDRIS